VKDDKLLQGRCSSDSVSQTRSLAFTRALSGRVPGHMTTSTSSPSQGIKRSASVLTFVMLLMSIEHGTKGAASSCWMYVGRSRCSVWVLRL